MCKNNGVLFESEFLQIGVKSEYRQNLGRIGVFYGNKTQLQFTAFCVEINQSNQLQSDILLQFQFCLQTICIIVQLDLLNLPP